MLIGPWILILNGTSSVGKSTIAKEYISTFNNEAKLLQIDREVIPVFIEKLSKFGQYYDSKSDFWTWFESLPDEIKKQVNSYENELFIEACQRMIEKAKQFYSDGYDVIIDTVLLEYEGESYTCFKKAFEGLQTFFVFVYAPIDKMLENVKARNIPCVAAEKRSILDPFVLLFGHLCKKCAPQSPAKLELVTKRQFQELCNKLEKFINDSEQERSHKFSEKERLEKLITIANQKFFDKNETVIGIEPKYAYDYIIHSGAGPIECARSLHEWITTKRTKN